jgi:heterogeneous nuclear rnp K-like protein 2
MSASPTTAPTQSTKRPLEDPSSPSAPSDQPDAKRPALDKIVKGEEEKQEEEQEPIASAEAEAPAPISNGDAKVEDTNGTKPEIKDAQGDTVVTDAPTTKDGAQPIESTVTTGRTQNSSSGASASGSALPHDESGWIHIRAVITSSEAATVIGKGGENVSMIRKLSGAKCTVSDYQKGAVERILTVSGVVDAVAKVCFLICHLMISS